MNFLSLRFYVKSKLANPQSQNLPILTYLKALNFDLYEFLHMHFLKASIYQIKKIQSP